MARFNTIQSTVSITDTTTLTYVIDKSTILLTGTSGYTLTLANPTSFPGSVQAIYNATGGNVTISTPVNNIIGNGFTSAGSQIIPNNTTYTLTSDGTDYVVTNNQGGPISVTSGTFSSTVTMNPANASVTISPTGSGTVTINPATAGSINNIAIGGTTRAAGSFTSLAANGAVIMTQNTASTTTGTGTLVITGGLGVSGRINAANFDGVVGANTAAAGTFTTLSATSTVGLSPANAAVTVSPTGSGTVTINPATAGTINNMSIGASTKASGGFTTLTVTSTVSANGGTGSAGEVLTSDGSGSPAKWASPTINLTAPYNSTNVTVNAYNQITGYTQGGYTVSSITYSDTTEFALITGYTESENGITKTVAVTYLANGKINAITVS